MLPSKGQRLCQVGFALGPVNCPAGRHLDDDVAVKAVTRKVLKNLRTRLGATTGDEVLIASGAGAVGQVHM